MNKNGCTITALIGSILAVCSGVFIGLFTTVLERIPAINAVLDSCVKVLTQGWNLLSATSAFPNWFLLLWVCASIWSVAFLLRSKTAFLKIGQEAEPAKADSNIVDETKKVQPKEPSKLAYRRDIFFDLWWYWKWSLNGRWKIYKCCCPRPDCHLQLEVRGGVDSSTNQVATQYICDVHGPVATLPGNHSDIERRVMKLVQKNYDTGEWTRIVQEQENNSIFKHGD